MCNFLEYKGSPLSALSVSSQPFHSSRKVVRADRFKDRVPEIREFVLRVRNRAARQRADHAGNHSPVSALCPGLFPSMLTHVTFATDMSRCWIVISAMFANSICQCLSSLNTPRDFHTHPALSPSSIFNYQKAYSVRQRISFANHFAFAQGGFPPVPVLPLTRVRPLPPFKIGTDPRRVDHSGRDARVEQEISLASGTSSSLAFPRLFPARPPSSRLDSLTLSLLFCHIGWTSRRARGARAARR